MGKYQLSLQGTYSDRLDATQRYFGGRVSSTECRNRVKDVANQSDSPKKIHQNGVVERERVQDGGTQPPRFKLSPPRHSTAYCDGLLERREVEKLRLRMQRANVVVPLQNSNSAGQSFRSEDSESLALWEEKEQPASRSSRWMKLTTQSPRWLDAMRKFDTLKLAPWRSSPVHPKLSLDSSQRSLHRKMSNRSLHELSKLPWYSNTSKKSRNGESRSAPSPPTASTLSRLSGELNPSIDPSTAWADETKDDCKRGSFSRLRVASSEADMPTFHEEHTSPADKSANTRPGDTAPAIIVGAPAVFKLLGVEEEDELALDIVKSEDTAFFKREETPENLGVGEMIGDVEETQCISLDPLSRLSNSSPTSPSRRMLRKHHSVKSKSEPLDGLYSKQSMSSTAIYCIKNPMPTSHTPLSPWEAIVARGEVDVGIDMTSGMSKSSSTSNSPLKKISSRVESPTTRDQLLSRLGSTASKSSHSFQLGNKSDNEECCDLSSPRSILCGPDRDTLPSPNPSLRSDPGIVSFSALATTESQCNSSTSASFDLNKHDFEEMHTAYDLNATAPCKPVESRRGSLSFRDFGPSRPSSEIAAPKVDPKAVGTATSAVTNMKLLECDDQPDKNEPWSSPKPFQSPEFWATTVSTQYHGDESPQSTPETCISCKRICPHSAPPLSRLSYAIPLEAEQLQQMPIVVPRSRSRHSEFTSRLGGVFSPLRLPANNRSCFEAHLLSPPHDFEVRSPTYAATVELLLPSAPQSSTKLKKLKSSRRRYSSEDTPTVMTSMSKAVKKILSKCKIPHSKGKCKVDSPVVGTPRPGSFHQGM